MAESGLIKDLDQLHRYGFIHLFTVEPIVFGKDPNHRHTAYLVREWCRKNLKDLWDLRIIRIHLWTKDVGYFEITCMSEAEGRKVHDFFNEGC